MNNNLPRQLFLAKQDGMKLSETLRHYTEHATLLRVLVGYFYFSGIKIIYDSLKANPDVKLKILVGMDAEVGLGNVAEVARDAADVSEEDVFDNFIDGMRKVLGSSAVDSKEFHERVDLFAELILNGRLELRKTREPNHAKIYLFDFKEDELMSHALITGSSNLTAPGLKGQPEINVHISSFGWDNASAYFDAWWDDAVPLTETEEQRRTIIRVLEDETVAAKVTPYEAWLKIVTEYVASREGTFKGEMYSKILEKAGMTEYKYQRDAVIQAQRILEDMGGVIIADVVGLGKSIIGSLIGRMSGKRGLVLCPPGLVGDEAKRTGWRHYCDLFRLDGWKVFSSGDLGKVVDYLEGDNSFEMVMIDEVHRFKNLGTEEYDNLMRICGGRKVVELTATPFNNKPDDILALLRLFSPLKGSPLVPGGDLEAVFSNLNVKYKAILRALKIIEAKSSEPEEITKALVNCGIDALRCNPKDRSKCHAEVRKEMDKLGQKLRGILMNVAIRRNRIDLKNDPEYKEEVSAAITPEPPLPQYYELTPEQDAFYDNVITKWFGTGPDGNDEPMFKGPFYRPYKYKIAKGNGGAADDEDEESADTEEVSQKNLYRFMRRLLVRRFESSFGAFRKSVDNQINFLEKMKGFVKKSNVVIYAAGTLKEIEKLMQLDDDAFEPGLEELIAKVEAESALKTRQIESIYKMEVENFKVEKFFADIDSDINLFRTVREEYDKCGLAANDPKAQELIETCRTVLNGSHDNVEKGKNDPKRKIVVFTEFKDTLSHLESQFASSGLRAKAAYSVSDDVRENFDASYPAKAQKDDYDIILATDKLSEGLNLNRAGVVVNYDIPWNPTRVIQRVGRINRIGKRVFGKLYIMNFFPTLKGQQIDRSKQIAQAKIFAIHGALGEDAQFFDESEKPTAAALFEKIGTFKEDDSEEVSFYTKCRMDIAEAKASHPETYEKVQNLPNLIKAAMPKGMGDVYLFEKQGQAFRARKWHDGNVTEEEIATAVNAVKCPFETERGSLPDGFWKEVPSGKSGESQVGPYAMLRQYKAIGEGNGGVVSKHATAAMAALTSYCAKDGAKHVRFVKTLMRDISDVGTVSLMTLKQIAIQARADVNTLDAFIEELWKRHDRDDNYLKNARKYPEKSVIVTVANV